MIADLPIALFGVLLAKQHASNMPPQGFNVQSKQHARLLSDCCCCVFSGGSPGKT